MFDEPIGYDIRGCMSVIADMINSGRNVLPERVLHSLENALDEIRNLYAGELSETFTSRGGRV
jgi:hypothetical protein